MSESHEQKGPPPETMKAPDTYFPVKFDGIVKNLGQLINFNDNIMHEPTCVICSSPYRTDIEAKWLETKSTIETQKFIKQKAKLDLTDAIIDNHMLIHLNSGIKEIQKIEYADRIRRLSNNDLGTLDRIKIALSAIDERIMGINSIIPSQNTSQVEIEKIKSSELTKLMATYEKLIKLQASILGEMEKQGSMIRIPKAAFLDWYNRMMVEAKNPEEKQIVKKILGELKSLAQSS